MSTALRVTQYRWRTFPVAQRVTTNLFVDKVDRCTLELQMETEVDLADSGGIAEVFQLFPPRRNPERIVEQIVDCSRSRTIKQFIAPRSLGEPSSESFTAQFVARLPHLLCGVLPAGGVPGQREKSTLRAHRMAVMNAHV